MMHEPAVDAGIDEDSASDSSEGVDLEYESSSEFIPSDDEPEDESDGDPENDPPNPRHHRHRPRGIRRDIVRTQAHAQHPNSPRGPFFGKDMWLYSLRRLRYYPSHIPLRWENRSLIYNEYREVFEYEVFRRTFPELSELNIPRARREVIMMMDNRDGIGSSTSVKNIWSGFSGKKSKCLQRNDISSSPQPKCFLSLLPLEVQVQILRYCLKSETPFLDFCFGYRFAASELANTAQKGQDDVTLGILCTNRHFRAQGLRILWQQNTFLYTRSDEFTLLNTDRLMKFSHITFIRDLIIHQDCVWRPQMFYDRVMLDSILFAVSATEQLPALRSLQLDLVHTAVHPYCYERGKRVQDILLEAKYFLCDIRAGRLVRHLQKVSVKGFSDDDLGCLAVKLASFLVDPGEGRLGVGLVDVRYGFFTHWCGRDYEMVYMSMENVDEWLDWRRQQHGHLPKVFEWEDYFPVEMIEDACLES